VSEANVFGLYIYKVFVNDKYYDQFTSNVYLTWAQMSDVESYYQDALDNYDPPMLELSDYEKKRRH
jgi:hypothetical protein